MSHLGHSVIDTFAAIKVCSGNILSWEKITVPRPLKTIYLRFRNNVVAGCREMTDQSATTS